MLLINGARFINRTGLKMQPNKYIVHSSYTNMNDFSVDTPHLHEKKLTFFIQVKLQYMNTTTGMQNVAG